MTEFLFILADLLTNMMPTRTGFLHKFYEFYDWVFSLISSVLNNIQLHVVLDGNPVQESFISEVFFKSPFLLGFFYRAYNT